MWYRYSQKYKKKINPFFDLPMAPLRPGKKDGFYSDGPAVKSPRIVPKMPAQEIPEAPVVQETPSDQNAPVSVPEWKYALPPVHAHCHCYIEQKPGGRKIWQFKKHCCPECYALARIFNHQQFETFGI